MRLLIVVLFLLVPFSVVSCMSWFHGHDHADEDHHHKPLQFSETSGKNIAKGIVYEDLNRNRRYDLSDVVLPGVQVSNGEDIVKTDSDGRYRISVGEDTIIFVIKPRGYMTPLSKANLPQFYYIHKPKGSPKQNYPGVKPTGPLPEQIDFPLNKQKEPERFHIITFSDPQPRNVREIGYAKKDVFEELVGTDAKFGVTLGDIVFNPLSLFDEINAAVSIIGIPWYNVIGNHDSNYDARGQDKYSDETFESVYGPPYYSFNYGPVHFIVLDDVIWAPGNGKQYEGGLSETQLRFIENDLKQIPKNQMICFFMHIPMVSIRAKDKKRLLDLIEDRPMSVSFSGHWHRQKHYFIRRPDGGLAKKPHHHVVTISVSGNLWRGLPDKRGIPHALGSDGTPNGYLVVTFDGDDYSFRYKGAGFPEDFQMRIYAPQKMTLAIAKKIMIKVNVFDGNEKSKVEMRPSWSKDWVKMTQFTAQDPEHNLRLYYGNKKTEKPYRKMKYGGPTTHLWQAKLPEGARVGQHFVHVRIVDMFGQGYEAKREISITEDVVVPPEKESSE